jgi:hypothetical protein
MPEPTIIRGFRERGGSDPTSATGASFEVHEWQGSGPPYMHVHHSDDEAWYVLEGTLTFKFTDREVDAPAGSTVFVPAGVAHTYFEKDGPARYLITLTPRLSALISALHAAPFATHAEVSRQFHSEIVS